MLRVTTAALLAGFFPGTGLVAVWSPAPLAGQTLDSARVERLKEELPLSPDRVLETTAREGSWMSVDVSPDGETLVFDLLGDLWTLPASGGRATPLTQGMGFDAMPRFSPDGEDVVFVSDRDGDENLWILSLDLTDTWPAPGPGLSLGPPGEHRDPPGRPERADPGRRHPGRSVAPVPGCGTLLLAGRGGEPEPRGGNPTVRRSP